MAYDGTLVFVSHDRWFVGQLATRIIEITPEGINDFPGTYEEYLERCGDDHLDAQVVLRKARAARRDAREDGKARAARREAREDGKAREAKGEGGKAPRGKKRAGPTPDRRRKKLEARLERVTEEMQAAESRIEALNQRFCAPDFFEVTPGDERAALEAEHRELTAKTGELMAEWETLENELGS